MGSVQEVPNYGGSGGASTSAANTWTGAQTITTNYLILDDGSTTPFQTGIKTKWSGLVQCQLDLYGLTFPTSDRNITWGGGNGASDVGLSWESALRLRLDRGYGSTATSDFHLRNLYADGTVNLSATTTPANTAQSADGNLYVKGGKLIAQYNDAGTVRYKYLDLTGTGVTWVHTTSAP